MATLTFADRLAAEVERKRSQLVVGLDPNPDLLPVELRGDVARFCCGIVDAVAPHAVAVKPQLAFFEAPGRRDGCVRRGVRVRPPRRAPRDRRRQARRHRLDRARVRRAYLGGDTPRADALTVNPWLGRDAVEPFLGAVRRGGAGIFVLVEPRTPAATSRTSCSATAGPCGTTSRGSSTNGARIVGEVGLSSVGAVVGATHPRAVAEARRLMPRTILLLPGVGAQGGAVGRPRARVPERPGERARLGVALGDLRVPGVRHGLPGGGRRRGVSAPARRSGPPPAGSAHTTTGGGTSAPAAFLLAVTVAVVLIRAGHRTPARRHDAGPDHVAARHRRRSRREARPRGGSGRFAQATRSASISSEDRRAGRDDRAAEPEASVDLALHRGEDPHQMRRARSRCSTLARSARPPRGAGRCRARRSARAPGSSRTPRTGEVLASSNAHERCRSRRSRS